MPQDQQDQSADMTAAMGVVQAYNFPPPRLWLRLAVSIASADPKQPHVWVQIQWASPLLIRRLETGAFEAPDFDEHGANPSYWHNQGTTLMEAGAFLQFMECMNREVRAAGSLSKCFIVGLDGLIQGYDRWVMLRCEELRKLHKIPVGTRIDDADPAMFPGMPTVV